ncbi:retrovirus-related pol polyprotein from transposon TNT 1-94 [Tanacetum coccineum]
MIRSFTKELFSPFENPEQKFRSRRRLFDTLSLVESNSPKFDHISDIEEQSGEEVSETMTKTMEQYMSKTRGDYGLGVTRPTINQDTQFELKGQFLKELHDNTFSGSEHEDENEHIEKVLEIVDLFHILKVTQDQIMLKAFPVSLTGAASRWLRNQPSGSITTWEVLKTKFLNKYCPPAQLLMKCPQHYLTDMQEVILFYNGLDVPTRQILDSKGTIPSKTATDAKIAIQEMAKYSQKWHNGTSSRTRSTKTFDGLDKPKTLRASKKPMRVVLVSAQKVDKPIKVGILGASGYTGVELIRFIANHPYFNISLMTADRKAGQSIGSVFPHLITQVIYLAKNETGDNHLVAVKDADFSSVDAVFCCLPHGTTQEIIKGLPTRLKIVDLSADFRLRDINDYAEWYGQPHKATELQISPVLSIRTEIASSCAEISDHFYLQV